MRDFVEGSFVLPLVVLVAVLLLVTGVKQSQLQGLRLRLQFDKIYLAS